MSVGQPPRTTVSDPHDRRPDPRLPLRWALILSISGACGVMVGTLEGPPAGLLTFLTALGLLYRVVRDR